MYRLLQPVMGYHGTVHKRGLHKRKRVGTCEHRRGYLARESAQAKARRHV